MNDTERMRSAQNIVKFLKDHDILEMQLSCEKMGQVVDQARWKRFSIQKPRFPHLPGHSRAVSGSGNSRSFPLRPGESGPEAANTRGTLA